MRDKKVGGDTVAPLWNVAKSYGAGGASVTRQSWRSRTGHESGYLELLDVVKEAS